MKNLVDKYLVENKESHGEDNLSVEENNEVDPEVLDIVEK